MYKNKYSYRNEQDKLRHRIALQKHMHNAPMGSKVIIKDYSDYEDGLCNNGGHYSFTDVYEKCSKGWRASYYTSADFPYCEYCGSFYNDYHDCGKPSMLETKEVIAIIQSKWYSKDIVITVC